MQAMTMETLGIDNLQLRELPDPTPGPGEVLVRLRAASLNYRDLLVAEGGYGSRQKRANLIPLSDGAGEVVRLGADVAQWRAGDRVAGCFFPDWQSGPPGEAYQHGDPGGREDGMAAQLRLFRQDALVGIPSAMSFTEAACLPCAALTAWNAVRVQGQVGPEHVVLTQGSGGVALFALQFATMAGARVIATSSTPDKLQRLRQLGADHVINYREQPEWGKVALGLTRDGVDLVVETGGAATLKQSMRATRVAGTIAVIGVVSGAAVEINLGILAMSSVRLQGVMVGNREQFRQMLAAMERHATRPVIDRTFPLAELPQAMRYMKTGRHFGKICVEI